MAPNMSAGQESLLSRALRLMWVSAVGSPNRQSCSLSESVACIAHLSTAPVSLLASWRACTGIYRIISPELGSQSLTLDYVYLMHYIYSSLFTWSVVRNSSVASLLFLVTVTLLFSTSSCKSSHGEVV